MRLTATLLGSLLTLGVLAGCGGGVTPNDGPGLTDPSPIVQDFSVNPDSVSAGAATTGTVTLTAPAPVDTVLPLLSASPNVTLPASVTVPQGQASATFQVQTHVKGVAAVQSVTAQVSTFSGATGFSTPLTIVNPRIQGVTFDPAPVVAGTATTGTVTMDRAVGADTMIALERTAGTSATVPASVTAPAGQTSATFPVPTSAVGDVNPQQIGATSAGQTMTAAFGITSSTVLGVTLSRIPNSDGYEGHVTLNRDAPVDVPVDFQLSDTTNANVDIPFGEGVIYEGKNQLLFVVLTNGAGLPPGDTVVTLTATSPALPGQNASAQVTITVPSPPTTTAPVLRR